MAALPAHPSFLRPSPPVLYRNSQREPLRVVSNLNHLGDIVRNDFEFFKKGIGKGINWANRTLRVPQLTAAVDDVVWLRKLEDPHAPPLQPPPWPQPSYPELSGVDLLMADMKALEAYGGYLYYLCRVWSKPLPEVYDPQDVAHYFNCRPHLVAFRLIEVFSAFAAAMVKIRTLDMTENFRSDSKKNVDGNVSHSNFGIVLKETMLNLGPTFIKVGQSLSTRPDIIGTEMSKALSELHDQIPPFPRETAMKIIEEELGSPIQSVFSHISEEPVAAASFGQVYSANTPDGHKIAVKVQRPNLCHVVVRDIYILRLGLGVLQRVAKRKSDLRLYADELGKGLVGELDYTLEAANASMFLEAHSSFPFIRVPKVYHNLTRKRVLTMEWIVGESPTDLLTRSTSNVADHGFVYPEKKLEAKKNLLEVVSKGVEASLIQLLETGLLHADPHPGNLRYTSSGQIGFLDFGLLCRMEKKHQFAMLASIVHIVNGDWESLVRSLIEMDVVRPGTNIRRVTMELEDSLGEVEFRDGIPDVKFSRVLSKIWSVALKYHFRMPPYYTLVLRSLASLEGLAVAADPNFKTFEAAYPYVVRKLLTENSAETRKILFSVVLNKKKEFRWERFALFLRVGSSRKVLSSVIASKSGSSLDYLPDRSNDVFDISSLILRILPSKDGVVIRKLLMTANGASLVRAFISKEATFFRQQICRLIADVLYQWMIQALGFGQGMIAGQYSSQAQFISRPGNGEPGVSSRASISIHDYQSILTDRRLKVIFMRILDSARKEPVLMLKFYWTSFTLLAMASALAFYHCLVSLASTYISKLLPSPKRVATGV